MNYKPRLDGIRFIAIFMVLTGHYLWFVRGYIGVYGVNLFFVLSGYLITSILLSEKGKPFGASYKKFILRRALRIFPLYYTVVILLIILRVRDIDNDWGYLLSYTFNIRAGNIRGWESYVYGAYWSLSVEEQFYLVFPFIILLLNRYPGIQISSIILIIIIAYFERIYSFIGPKEHNYVSLITNMGALSIGGAGAWFTKYKYLNKAFFTSFPVEILMLTGLIFVLLKVPLSLYLLLVPFFNIFFIIKASSFQFRIGAIDKLLVNKWILLIGKISYGIYIFHIGVLKFLEKNIINPLWQQIPFEKLGYFSKLYYNKTLIQYPFISLVTIGIAYLSYTYFEAPILKLKDKYFAS